MLGPHQLSHLRVLMYRLFHKFEGMPYLKHFSEVGLDGIELMKSIWGGTLIMQLSHDMLSLSQEQEKED